MAMLSERDLRELNRFMLIPANNFNEMRVRTDQFNEGCTGIKHSTAWAEAT